MAKTLKNLFSGLLNRDEKRESGNSGTGFGERGAHQQEDESVLAEEVPYKLEPNLALAEKYIDRIRRQGW